MGHPPRTPETGLNMKPRCPLLSSLLFSLPSTQRVNCAKPTLQRQDPNWIWFWLFCLHPSNIHKQIRVMTNDKWRTKDKSCKQQQNRLQLSQSYPVVAHHYWGNQTAMIHQFLRAVIKYIRQKSSDVNIHDDTGYSFTGIHFKFIKSKLNQLGL